MVADSLAMAEAGADAVASELLELPPQAASVPVAMSATAAVAMILEGVRMVDSSLWPQVVRH
jgi:hypothetical protein